MILSVTNQANIFIYSCIGGMLISFIFDIFRIKRRIFKTGIIAVYIEDFIYWIIVAITLFEVVYYSNEGELRGYIILGIVLGVILYILLFSKLIIKFITSVIYIAYKILFIPLQTIYNFAKIPSRFCFKTLRKYKCFIKIQFEKKYILKKIFKNIIRKI